MKILIKEQQLDNLAYRLVLDRLNDMDFKFKKNKEFSFFPKGTHDVDNGVEADWVKGEGYSVLVGNSLWRSIKDLFGLTDDQTQTAFIKAFIDKGIHKISEVTTIDFSPHYDMLGGNVNEGIIKEFKNDRMNELAFNYLNNQDWYTWDIGDGEFNVTDGEYGKDVIRYRIQNPTVGDSFSEIYLDDDFVSNIIKLFGLNPEDAVISVINWFNKKYDKNLTKDNFEWIEGDTYYAEDDDDDDY
jgi:hypothetical protein